MLTYVVAPLVGAVIGYVTNYLAIKMMLRPYEAHYIGRWRVPFTPGVVPKEKPRIARAIGQAVANHLMNEEILKKNLLSDDMLGKIGEAIDAFLQEQISDSKTLREFVGQYLKQEELASLSDEMTGEIGKSLCGRLQEVGLDKRIASMAVQHAFGKVSDSALGLLGVDKLLQAAMAPVEALLSNQINDFMASHAQELIDEMMVKEREHLLDTSLSELLSDAEVRGRMRRYALTLYTSFVSAHLPQVLKTLDISRIIEARINEMEMCEAEAIVMSVLRNEMQSLCLLGAVLGALIGCVNLLF